MTDLVEILTAKESFHHCGHTIAHNPDEPFRVFNTVGHLVGLCETEVVAKQLAARSRIKELVTELNDITQNHLY